MTNETDAHRLGFLRGFFGSELRAQTYLQMESERDALRSENERMRLLLDPDAVDDFAELQSENERWRQLATDTISALHNAVTARDEARAEIARLRATKQNTERS